MITMQSIIVPQISTYPAPEARARKVLAWLVAQNIVDEQLTTCGLNGNRMAYAIAQGAWQVLDTGRGAGRLPTLWPQRAWFGDGHSALHLHPRKRF